MKITLKCPYWNNALLWLYAVFSFSPVFSLYTSFFTSSNGNEDDGTEHELEKSNIPEFKPVGCFRDHGRRPRPLPRLIANFRGGIELAKRVSVTLVFSSIENVGAEWMLNVRITSKELPQGAFMESEEEKQILFTSSKRKVLFLSFL